MDGVGSKEERKWGPYNTVNNKEVVPMRSFQIFVVLAILILGITSCATPPASIETPAPIEEPMVQPTAAEPMEEPTAVPPRRFPGLVTRPLIENPTVQPTLTETADDLLNELALLDGDVEEERVGVEEAIVALMQLEAEFLECKTHSIFEEEATTELVERAKQIMNAIGKVRIAYLARWFSLMRRVRPLPEELERCHESFNWTGNELFKRTETFAYMVLDRFCTGTIEQMVQRTTEALETLRARRGEISEEKLEEMRRALEAARTTSEKLPEDVDKLEVTSALLRKLDRLSDELERELREE